MYFYLVVVQMLLRISQEQTIKTLNINTAYEYSFVNTIKNVSKGNIPNYINKLEIKNEVLSSGYTQMINGVNRILLATNRDSMVQDQHVANNTNFKADLFDVMGYLTSVPIQYIFLSESDLSQSRKYYISVFRTVNSTFVRSQISVNMISMANCSSFCQSKGMCMDNHCDCKKKELPSQRYFGRDCLIKAQKLAVNKKQTVVLSSSQLYHYYFEISDDEDHYLQLIRLGKQMNVAFFINKQFDKYHEMVPAHANFNDYQSKLIRYNLNIRIPRSYLTRNYGQTRTVENNKIRTLFISFQNHEKEDVRIELAIYGRNSGLQRLTDIDLQDLSQRGFFYFITIIVICITVMGCLCICFRTKVCMHIMGESRNRSNNQRVMVRRSNKLTQQDIDQYIVTKPFSEHKPYILDQNNPIEYNEDVDCIICLESFEDNDPTKLTSCYHIYHASCLAEWVLLNQNCPFCRASLTRKDIIEKSKIKMVQKHVKTQSLKLKNLDTQVEIVAQNDNVQINKSGKGVRIFNDDIQRIQIRGRNDQSVESYNQSDQVANLQPDPNEIYMSNQPIQPQNSRSQRVHSQDNF